MDLMVQICREPFITKINAVVRFQFFSSRFGTFNNHPKMEENSKWIILGWTVCGYKKVLQRDCKRHTARRVVSTRSAVLSGGGGYSSPDQGGCPQSQLGTLVPAGKYPSPSQGVLPPLVDRQTPVKTVGTFPILQMRAVKKASVKYKNGYGMKWIDVQWFPSWPGKCIGWYVNQWPSLSDGFSQTTVAIQTHPFRQQATSIFRPCSDLRVMRPLQL